MKQRIVALWREGDAHQAAGRLAEAERCFREVVDLTGGNPHPTDRLAQVLRGQGRLAEAAENAARAVAGAPDEPVFHNTAAGIADAAGDQRGAERSYIRALLLDPGVPLWAPLASVRYRAGAPGRAVLPYRRALLLAPGDGGLLFELGAARQAAGDAEAARACYARLLRDTPDHVPAMRNLSVLTLENADPDGAETWLRRALVISPEERELLRQLGVLVLNRGAVSEAFGIQRWGTRLNPDDPDSWGALADAGRNLSPDHADAGAFADLVTCMTRRVVAPAVLVGPAVALLTHDVDFTIACRDLARTDPGRSAEMFADDGLPAAFRAEPFRVLLRLTVLPDPDIEAALTALRAALLTLAAAGRLEGARTSALRDFALALAAQCQLNEQVFPETDEERRSVEALENALWDHGHYCLAALVHACYRPALDLETGDDPDFAAFHWRHVAAKRREREIAAEIPLLTPIQEGVSAAVREQYEENPYPRWTELPEPRPRSLAAALARRFPNAAPDFSGLSKHPDILIGGCGTGQQALSAVGRYENAQILAVDLSRASLGYAERMRAELGIAGVSFAQADILRLGDLDRRFDLIESIGVLHHMADPVAGWRVLAGLLKPGGVMEIGLYSEIARAPVVHARERIAEWDLGDSAGDIREARRRLMAERGGGETAALFISPDFYSLSTCRDLLFHVQEHRFTIDGLRTAIDGLDLDFLGFETTSAGARAFRERFPADADATDFGKWKIFEAENPGFFGAMYRFWVRHRG